MSVLAQLTHLKIDLATLEQLSKSYIDAKCIDTCIDTFIDTDSTDAVFNQTFQRAQHFFPWTLLTAGTEGW